MITLIVVLLYLNVVSLAVAVQTRGEPLEFE